MRFNERLLHDLGISKADLATLRVILDNNNDLGTMAIQDADSVNIDGGNIDATIIGDDIPAAGSFSTVDIDGGNIDGTVVGAATTAAGSFTDITGTIITASQPNITEVGTITSLVVTSADIDGGTIDGTTIGATTPSTGSFSSVDIDGGNIDGAIIGAATPAAGNFSTVDIDGGLIDGTQIGSGSAAAATFTNMTCTAGTINGNDIGGTSPSTARFTTLQVNTNTKSSATAGITAFATGGQASATELTSDINEISTVATTADSVKLLTAVKGYKIIIINNGANAMDVFPGSSDNLGAGVDTAVSLAAGANITYASYDNTNWVSV